MEYRRGRISQDYLRLATRAVCRLNSDLLQCGWDGGCGWGFGDDGGQVAELERLARSHTAPAREVRQAKALLWATDGVSNAEIARRCASTPKSVRRWRSRFAAEGTAAVGRNRAGRGRPVVLGDHVVEAIVHDTLHTVPEDGSACWSTSRWRPGTGSARTRWPGYGRHGGSGRGRRRPSSCPQTMTHDYKEKRPAGRLDEQSRRYGSVTVGIRRGAGPKDFPGLTDDDLRWRVVDLVADAYGNDNPLLIVEHVGPLFEKLVDLISFRSRPRFFGVSSISTLRPQFRSARAEVGCFLPPRR